MAFENGSVEVAKLLLSVGANIHHVNSDGETAFTRAVRCEDGSEDGETLLMITLGFQALFGCWPP